ncbi:MAG: hypothetical protein KBD64_00965 [Gammaproteobacteria bacterium]|nr:hypothetical protein [Gammaproteobacteria bacterium]
MAKIHHHSFWRLLAPQYLLTWPLLFAFLLISKLPYSAVFYIGRALGKLAYCFFPKRKYIIRTNLSLCFPEKSPTEIEQLLKENLESLCIGACETALAWFGPDKTIKIIENNLVINNEDRLKNALSSGRPVLLITPHASSQELLSKIMVKKYSFTPVFRHLNNPVANYFMQKARIKIYPNLIQKADTRQIVKALKQKLTIGILPDQDFGRRRSVFAEFFGVSAATTTALSKYKKLTNAQIVALSYVRDKQDITKFTVNISEPLDITGYNLEQDARTLNKELEKIITKDISMYFWVARRFKTRPLGEEKIYNYQRTMLSYLK